MSKTYSVVMVRMYQPDMQGLGSPRIVRDELTLEDARGAVERLDNEVYVTANGEAGRPQYYVLEDGQAEYYCGGRDGDGSNYDWAGWEDVCQSPRDGNACGECAGCIQMMIDEDVAGVRGSAE